ncbi:MAG: SIS domain-containing protein [Planctomycetes bacterium]|nr:SIS domain-containing protein [Planctomycetota bacterium]
MMRPTLSWMKPRHDRSSTRDGFMKAYRDVVVREVTAVLAKIDEDASRGFARLLARAKRIYISGVGRSGLVAKAFGQRLMHMGFDVHLADEITAPGISRGDVLVACSGTGRTQLTAYMARKARKIGARCVALTARARSPLAQWADLVIVVPAALERGADSRQPARSLFEQALFLYLDSIVLAMMQELGISEEKMRRRHSNLE